jgi:glycosyltransferase involved in cell wall biosynthesis
MIITVTRCLNEEKNIERFINGYRFSDLIIVSDGGSTDKSLDILWQYRSFVQVLNFNQTVEINGVNWNPDNPHINFIIDAAKSYNPDWIILDDMDDVPNELLKLDARKILTETDKVQVNAFRLYLWGDSQYFPQMNNNFDPAYKSLWAWKPKEVNIAADNNQHHGTIIGLAEDPLGLDTPYCLLHKSWHPDTIQAKVDRYNKIGIKMNHPLEFAGVPVELPNWGYE